MRTSYASLPEFPIDIAAEVLFQDAPATVCVGSVAYDHTRGFTLTRNGDLVFRLGDTGIVLATMSGHSIRLVSKDLDMYKSPVLQNFQSITFDAALLSETDLSRDLGITQWKLPCNEILDHLDERSIKAAFKHRTVTEVRARNWTTFRGRVKQFNANILLEQAYEVRGTANGSHHLEPLVAFEITYSKPRLLEQVLEHEAQLREFLDFLWMRHHVTPDLYLREGDDSILYKRKQELPRDRTLLERALLFPDELTKTNFNNWLNKWLALPQAYHRALTNILRLIRYPMVLTDLRFVMALHAFEALHEIRKKDISLKERLVEAAAPFYALDPLPRAEPLGDYFSRMVAARNEIIHLRQKSTAKLKDTERTRALYELLIVVRSMLLAELGCSQPEVELYCQSAFQKIVHHQFKHDNA